MRRKHESNVDAYKTVLTQMFTFKDTKYWLIQTHYLVQLVRLLSLKSILWFDLSAEFYSRSRIFLASITCSNIIICSLKRRLLQSIQIFTEVLNAFYIIETILFFF